MASGALSGLLLLGLAQTPLIPCLELDADDPAGRVAAVRGRFGQGPQKPLGPGLDVVATPRFLFVEDRARALPAAPWSTAAAWGEAFEMARSAWHAQEPDRARALVIFATFEAGDRELFYIALSNDTAGLGSGDEAELFDASPESVLEGYAWMGSLSALDEAGPDFATEAFLHELGHRWGAYLRLGAGFPADLLLGRNRTHWSFLADTDNSPMEGNRWRAADEGRWTTELETPRRFAFSPLDLYLMGLLPAEEVPPFVVLRPPLARVEPTWFNPRADAAPAHRVGVTVSGRPSGVSEVRIEDILAANGPRVPAARTPLEPVERPVAIILLSDGHTDPDVDLFEDFDRRLQGWLAAFEAATAGRMRLDADLVSAGLASPGEPCASVDDCDRTRSDRCAAPLEGGPAICTRTCLDHEACLDGCCLGERAPGLCAPAPVGSCGPVPAVPGDAGVAPARDAEVADLGDSPRPEEPGCGCRASRGPSPDAALLLAALGALRRTRRGPKDRLRGG